MDTCNPYTFLRNVQLGDLQEVYRRWVDSVAIRPLLDSAGGVSWLSSSEKYQILLADFHESREEVAEVLVHELLHVALFEVFGVNDHEPFHDDIRVAAHRLAIGYQDEVWTLLCRSVPAKDLEQTFAR